MLLATTKVINWFCINIASECGPRRGSSSVKYVIVRASVTTWHSSNVIKTVLRKAQPPLVAFLTVKNPQCKRTLHHVHFCSFA